MSNRGEFVGTVAVVTGGARGIGLACAQRLAEQGASVVIVDLEAAAARAAVSKLAIADPPHLGLSADVTVSADVSAAIERATREVGAPAIVVNNAGILRPTRFLDISEQEWNQVVAVSLNGAFLFSQACLPSMMRAGFGRIVNFSSTAGKSVSTLGGAHYTAAKAAVLGLTRALAKEMAPFGITVNAVCPGLIDTEMAHENCTVAQIEAYAASFPIHRLGQPSEVAELVAFLCSRRAAYITGASLDINGGDLMV